MQQQQQQSENLLVRLKDAAPGYCAGSWADVGPACMCRQQHQHQQWVLMHFLFGVAVSGIVNSAGGWANVGPAFGGSSSTAAAVGVSGLFFGLEFAPLGNRQWLSRCRACMHAAATAAAAVGIDRPSLIALA
jgi:hypothetical protein